MKKHVALLMSTLLVVIDQLLKLVATDYLKPIGAIRLIPDIFHFTYVENRGAAFGMMEGQKWLLIGVTTAVILFAVVITLMGKIENTSLLFAVATIIGGGVGNLIDRVYRNFVIDYIHVKAINFAVFNFADICVTVGTVWLLVYLIYGFKKDAIGETKSV